MTSALGTWEGEGVPIKKKQGRLGELCMYVLQISSKCDQAGGGSKFQKACGRHMHMPPLTIFKPKLNANPNPLVPAADVPVGDRRHRLRRLRHPDQRGRAPHLRALPRHARGARQRQGTQLRHTPR